MLISRVRSSQNDVYRLRWLFLRDQCGCFRASLAHFHCVCIYIKYTKCCLKYKGLG